MHARPISGQIARPSDEKKKMEEMKAGERRGTRRGAEPESPTDPSAERLRPSRGGGGGGAREPDRPQDFSTRRLIPPVRMASPNLPGDALGVPGGGGVLGLGISEASRPLHQRVIGKNIDFAPGIPGAF